MYRKHFGLNVDFAHPTPEKPFRASPSFANPKAPRKARQSSVQRALSTHGPLSPTTIDTHF